MLPGNLPLTREAILEILSEIADPEIPVLSVAEMGMLRDVVPENGGCEVTLTPTYTGCPAMGIIEADIKALLGSKGISPVTVRLVYTPAWTTDWIGEEARKKMKLYGIAPPQGRACNSSSTDETKAVCPQCGSSDTEMLSRWGATACKALYRCTRCLEPFEYFKCH